MASKFLGVHSCDSKASHDKGCSRCRHCHKAEYPRKRVYTEQTLRTQALVESCPSL